MMSFENTHTLSGHIKTCFKKPLSGIHSSGDSNIGILPDTFELHESDVEIRKKQKLLLQSKYMTKAEKLVQ